MKSKAAVFLLVVVLSSACGGGRNPEKFTLIEIRASGCEPCERTEPAVNELRRSFGTRLRFESHDINDPRGRLYVSQYRVRVVPTLIIIDDEGTARYRSEGVFDPSDVRRSVERLIAPSAQRE